MKKIIFLLFFFLLFSSDMSFSQSGWFWQNPVPQGNNLYSVNFVNANLVYVFGYAGTFLKSTNGGLNWTSNFYITGIGNDYNRIPKSINTSFFINSYTGFIATWDGALYDNVNNIMRTTNGGMTWDSVTTSTYPLFKTIFFINEQTGWSCCSYPYIGSSINKVLKTTNGGLNWFVQDTMIHAIYSTYFLNSNTGWFAGYYRIQTPTLSTAFYIYKTTNGGQSFITQLYNNQISQTLRTIFFINENTGWAGGTKLWKTTDSGNSWNSLDIQANSVRFISNETGYLINDVGVYKSTNSGLNWTPQSNIGGNCISTFGVNNIFTAGNYGILSKSNNGGANWQQLTTSITRDVLKRVYFVNSLTGYIADDSDSGKVLKTTNAGANWYIIFKLPGFNLYDLYFTNPNTGWAIGYSRIYNTINGGTNWTVQLITSYKIDKLCFINQNTGWASSHTTLFYTSNGGTDWMNICYPFYTVEYIHFFNASTGIIKGGPIRRTTDGGFNWQQVYTSPNGIDVDNLSNIYLMQFNSFCKSTDLGLTWNTVSTFSTMPIFTLEMINPSIGFGGGLYGWLVKTTNGGLNWYRQNSGYGGEIRSINFINEQTGWAVGDGGAILSTIDGGGNFVGIVSENGYLPSSPSLSQNYPNPLNPVTKIKYDIPPSKGARGMMTQLIIYDILGREIETLVNETQRPGSYEVTWDGSRYASGVYFYKLITDEYAETKKMVLIK